MKKKNLISDVLKNSHLNFKKIINNSDCIVSIKKLTPIRNFKLILSIIFLLSTTISNRIFSQPTYNSNRTFGGIGNDAAVKIIFDSNGNQIIVGNFSGTVDFDPNQGVNNLTSAGSDDMYILKLDNLGNFLWVKRIGGSGSENISNVEINSQGDIIFAGIFQNSVDFDPGVGTFNLTAAGQQDFVVEKLDNNGNFVFCKVVSGSYSDIVVNLKLDSFGNIYSVGWFTGSNTDFDPSSTSFPLTASGTCDAFIWKLDPNGNFLWAKKIGGSGIDGAHGLDFDQQGNILVSGDFANTTDFDPGPGTFNITSYGSSDGFVVKLNSNGDFTWAIRVGGTLAEDAYRISCDFNGNVFVVGTFNGVSDFDPGNGTYNITSQGQKDIFLMKVDPLGNFQWAKSIGGSGQEYICDITLEAGGHFYVSGVFQNTVDLNPGLSTSNYTSIGLDDSFYSLFDPSGNQVWVKVIGGNGNDVIYKTFGYQGSLYLTGAFSNSVDFDPNSGVQNSTSNGLKDAFILKLNSNSCTYTIYDTVTVYHHDTITVYKTVTDTLIINTSVTGINSPNNINTIKVFPNPANNYITIDYGKFAIMNGYKLKIENSLGQQVFQTNIIQKSDYLSLTTWGGNGLYFIHIIDPQENTIEIRKIVLQ
jgi:hypothetical protein